MSIRDSSPTRVPLGPPLPFSGLARAYDVLIGWACTWQSQGEGGSPATHRNLVGSYQVCILKQDSAGQWCYGEDIYQPNTSQAERLTLGQVLWLGLRCVQIGYRQAKGCVSYWWRTIPPLHGRVWKIEIPASDLRARPSRPRW